jgi:hypothetical protein
MAKKKKAAKRGAAKPSSLEKRVATLERKVKQLEKLVGPAGTPGG